MKSFQKFNVLIFSEKCAFTLAETLITLVIVGIVAALTVPGLIAKYQHQQLESQFKRSVSTISQIVLYAKNDLNENKLAQFCTEYTKGKGYYNKETCDSSIIKHLNLMNRNRKQSSVFYDIYRSNNDILTYNGKSKFVRDSALFALFYTNKMADGSFLGFYVSDLRLTFAIDSNGNKKPNKLGHDIFLFAINKKNDSIESYGTPNNNITDEKAKNYGETLTAYKDFYTNTYGFPCNLTSTRSGNGVGCAYYALKNVCPYDKTLKYFECLP